MPDAREPVPTSERRAVKYDAMAPMPALAVGYRVPESILALANQKGGVAKTTSVASLGAAFVELGRRVLLIDLDPQACLTFSLGIDPDTVETSIHEVLTQGASIADAIVLAVYMPPQAPTDGQALRSTPS